MDKKIRPFILVTFLMLILIFILGVRYGQSVEKANKKINFMISIAPTRPIPTEKPLNFATHTSKGCALEFLYPSTLSILKESTLSAEFGKDKKTYLKYSCEKIALKPSNVAGTAEASLEARTIVVTPALTFQSKKIVEEKSTQGGLTLHSFIVKNPVINQDIRFTVEEKLYPLFEKTLKFGVQRE